MGLLLANILLALVWILVSGSFTVPNFLLGLVLAMAVLQLIRWHGSGPGHFARSLGILSLALLFLKELALSAWRVAVLVLSPSMDLKPGIFAYPLTVDRDFEIVLLANLVTLTPGTLSVEVSADRRTLYVHAIDCRDVDAAIADIRNGFERKIMEAFRR